MAKLQPFPELGELEITVLEHLWQRGEGDPKGVHDAIGKRRGITVNTIQSTLKRLFEKRLLERDKVSHAHVYRPRLAREAFQRAALEHLVSGLLRGEAASMISAFVDVTERAGPEHLAELEKLVAERRRAAKKPP
jgi:predicted transcriptional regulator